MSDPVAMSLDDYIKSQKRTGKMAFGRGGGRRGPKGNPNRGSQGSSGAAQKSTRGRRGRPSFNNVQRRRGNGNNFGGGRNRQFPANGSGFPRGNRVRGSGAGAQGQGLNRNRRNRNRQIRRGRNSGGQQGSSGLQQVGAANFRYFKGTKANTGGASVGIVNPRRNQARRLRVNKVAKVALNRQTFAVPNRNTKRAVQKLAKKRVQRAKLLVSRLKGGVAAGKQKKLISVSGRVALGKNGFVTVRNSNAKKMERALVQMKIARAQKARNRLVSPPQRTVNFAGPSTSTGGRRRNRSARRTPPAMAMGGGSALDWNTSIVRTMTNDLADEMSSSHLNPEIQRKIAFIQSRSKADRAPVMPDFRAPVTTSRMKLSDRFRLLNDQ